MPVKHIWCEVCESQKGPLFAVTGKDDGKKHYICKSCINILKLKNKRASNDERTSAKPEA